jgi:CopG family nickel-responsive transcriptional regulator
MSDVSRFGVSVEDDLLKSFDRLITEQGYPNRSEALRDLMRDALVRARLETHPDAAAVLGTLTLVYDHHASELTDRMAGIQHDHHELVVSVLHVHISHDDCMEVIVLRGTAGNVREIADSLLSLKGVKHGKLFVTLPSEEMVGGKRRARETTAPVHHAHAKARATRSGAKNG